MLWKNRAVLPAAALSVLAGVAVGLIVCFVAGCNQPVSNAAAQPLSPEETLCRQFVELKNAGNPEANNLLGPPPVVPATSVSPEEAQRLDTEIFLRRDYRIVEVRRADPGEGSPPRLFVFVVDGNLVSEPMRVGRDDVSTRQIYNPDLTVEVRDGKIHGVRSGIHEEPNQRPLTPAERRRLRRILIGEDP